MKSRNGSVAEATNIQAACLLAACVSLLQGCGPAEAGIAKSRLPDLSIAHSIKSAPTTPVDIGSSGTSPSGNRTPNFHGFDMLANGYYREFKRDITGDPVDPDSAALISDMSSKGLRIHVDFSSSTAGGGNSLYGIPINVVPGTQPLVPYSSLTYPKESDKGSVPIPSNPSIELYYSASGALPARSLISDGGDHHMLIAQRNEATGGIDKLYEMYQAFHEKGAWQGDNLAIFDLARGTPRPAGWTSADAGGLPMLPLMVRYDEVTSGAINHTLRITFNSGYIRNKYTYPGRHAAYPGSFTRGVPFGARLRLSRSWFDAHAGEYSGQARIILNAMRTYGVINADVGGNLFLSGISDERFDIKSIMTLQTVPASAFEMIQNTPGWSLTGPSCANLGQTVTLSMAHLPANDQNYDDNFWLQVNAGNFGGDGLSKALVHLRPGQSTNLFTYTPKSLGLHVINPSPSGADMLPPKPFTISVVASGCAASGSTDSK